MISVDDLVHDVDAHECFSPNFLAYMQLKVAVAQVEQLKRIADILDAVAKPIHGKDTSKAISVMEVSRFL